MICHKSPVRKLISSRQALCPIMLYASSCLMPTYAMHYHPMLHYTLSSHTIICYAPPEEPSHLPPFDSRPDPTLPKKIKQQKQSTKIPKQQDTAETINEITEKRKKTKTTPLYHATQGIHVHVIFPRSVSSLDVLQVRSHVYPSLVYPQRIKCVC